jgi:YtkA-like
MVRTPLLSLSLCAVALLAGCTAPPTELDRALTRPTLERKFMFALQPPARAASINQIHAWQMMLTSPAGVPITGARIAVDGGMPQHGHGLPTRPRVTPMAADGMYLLEGMKFSMPGWWEISLAIQVDGNADRVTFNTVAATPAAAP